tara:strand:+ start:6271 stop:8229 length:1959 start_codon:yes stop_codon:yes gene_type:complete
MKLKYFIIFFITLLSTSSFGDISTLSIHNEFVKAVVNNKDAKGRFSLETTLGNPDNNNDDYKDLIYGKPVPWTSYTTLLIDNNPFIFGNADKRLQKRTKTNFNYAPLYDQFVSNNSIISASKIKDFDISQKIGFYRNPNTNISDSIFIEYHVTNTSEETHYFGLRIMLDTKLGTNDGAPFRMGRDQIQSEIQLSKKDLYAYWQAFDSLSNPNIISQGLLTDSSNSLTIPDSIHLANWGSLVDQPWNAAYEQDRSFIRKGEDQKDTALALTFNSKPIKPKQTKIFKTVYGLGGIAISSGELSLGLTAPKSLLQTHDSPILVIAYLLNTGGYDAYNVSVSFTLPKDAEIIKGNLNESFPILQKGHQKQFPLLIKFKKRLTSDVSLSFSVKSSTFQANSIRHLIDIIDPPKLTLTMPKKIIIPPNNPYITISPTIHNITSIPINTINAFISGVSELALPAFEYPAKMIQELPPYSSTSLSWSIDTSKLQFPFSFHISATSEHAVNASQPIFLYQSLLESSTPLSVHSKSQAEVPYYLTLKLMNISSKDNHQFIITHPKKSATFIHYASSNQINMPLRYKKSRGDLFFQPSSLIDDYIYFNYYVTDDSALNFILSETMIETKNEATKLPNTRSVIQTLDLTVPSKNAIVSANYRKE